MSNRWLVAIGGVIGALVIAGVVVALLRSGQPANFPEGTPEGTVQRYLQALNRGDYDSAYAYLSSDAKQRQSLEDFRRNLTYRNEEIQQRQVVLDKSQVTGGTAQVTVKVTQFSPSGPLTFQPSESSFPASFSLKKEDGKWLISDSTWPVFFPIPIKPPPPPTTY